MILPPMPPRPVPFRVARARALALAALLAGIAPTARAANYVWTGNAGGNPNWATPTNWVNFQAPPSDLVNTDVFFGVGASLVPNLNQAYGVHSLTFNGGGSAYTFTGSALTLGTGGLTQNATTAQGFNNAVALNAAQNWTLAATAGALAFNGGLNTAGYALTVNAAATSGSGNVIGGAISGGGSLTQAGGGTLTLTGANAYTGGTVFAAGVLNAGSAGALGNTGTLSFTGGTLQYSAANTTDYSRRFSTAANQAVSVDTNGQSVTFTTGLGSSGGSLTKSGTGTLTLTGPSTYTGTTTINNGSLAVGNDANLSGGGNFTVNSANGLILSGSGRVSLATGSTFSVDIGADGSAGVASLSGIARLSTGPAFIGRTGTAIFNQTGGSFTASALYVGAGAGADGTYNLNGGTLTAGNTFVGFGSGGTGSFTQDGPSTHTTGTLTVGALNSSANGTYNLNAGTLAVNNVARGPGTGTFNFNGGVLQARQDGANFFQGLTAANVGGDFRVANSGTVVDANGHNVTIAQTLVHSPDDPVPLDGGLTKQGAGPLTLTGANTYTGITTVSAGALIVNNASGSATGNGDVTVGAGATLGGNGRIAGFVTVSSGGTLAPGALTPGQLTLGRLRLDGGSTLAITLGGPTAGSGGYDQVVVNGPADSSGTLPTLEVRTVNGFTPTVDETFTILRNTLNSPATQLLFSNAPSLYTDAAGERFQINYSANVDGGTFPNDVTLTYLGTSAVPEPGTWVLMLAGAAIWSAGACSRFVRVQRRRG